MGGEGGGVAHWNCSSVSGILLLSCMCALEDCDAPPAPTVVSRVVRPAADTCCTCGHAAAAAARVSGETGDWRTCKHTQK